MYIFVDWSIKGQKFQLQLHRFRHFSSNHSNAFVTMYLRKIITEVSYGKEGIAFTMSETNATEPKSDYLNILLLVRSFITVTTWYTTTVVSYRTSYFSLRHFASSIVILLHPIWPPKRRYNKDKTGLNLTYGRLTAMRNNRQWNYDLKSPLISRHNGHHVAGHYV